ncbi:MAG: threonylcarbamoyl-AMP synthase [Thermogemmatispora sp.]|uniref:Threonylcarbamoyl-AMP synthase n=1 Tax=Thermogemmatispora aurantia TaxID=2045279 RepID=A0A5J4K7X6_9CHLR|nr:MULTISPECIES: L-threonylcarbamoyladenylate synthase [Thermogemmatispora]MBE3564663.1 threonylcarbamoyl-AMP synthase [Thermogemmatispora sp.]GER83172.1 threonylcarbamoyl-AMP synthase [Thermogemmatispora aurantia]
MADDIKAVSTEVVPVDARQPEAAVIERAAALLRAGELVVFPTETVYGLGGDALREEAARRIFAAKGRPLTDPLIVHIAQVEELERVAAAVPERAWRLAEAFWPGPLTLILPRSEHVPRLVTAGLETVAVRMPSHPVAQALIRAAATPIAAPSANRFKHVSPTTAQHALADLNGRVPLILDGGPTPVGVESTVIDLCAAVPRILRPGGTSLEALREVLPEIEPPLPPRATASGQPESEEGQAQRAPGQLLVHYSPTVPLCLFEGEDQAQRTAIVAEALRHLKRGERVGILAASEDVEALRPCEERGALVRAPASLEEPEKVAAALFATLRELEAAAVDVILCRSFRPVGLGLAVQDRLRRAAGGRVIRVDPSAAAAEGVR